MQMRVFFFSYFSLGYAYYLHGDAAISSFVFFIPYRLWPIMSDNRH